MKRKKICMLGAFAVGKTSLVSRFVHSIFSDKYQTTVGVKIDKKNVAVDGEEVTLVVWDIYGEDAFQKVKPTFLRGSSGFLLVVDGTRPGTLEEAKLLRDRAREAAGDVPFLLLVNKSDLVGELEPGDSALAEEFGDMPVLRTSAKTGEGVEDAFVVITRAMLGG